MPAGLNASTRKSKNICQIYAKTFSRVRNVKIHVAALRQHIEEQCEKCFNKFNRKDETERLRLKCCRFVVFTSQTCLSKRDTIAGITERQAV